MSDWPNWKLRQTIVFVGSESYHIFWEALGDHGGATWSAGAPLKGASIIIKVGCLLGPAGARHRRSRESNRETHPHREIRDSTARQVMVGVNWKNPRQFGEKPAVPPQTRTTTWPLLSDCGTVRALSRSARFSRNRKREEIHARNGQVIPSRRFSGSRASFGMDFSHWEMRATIRSLVVSLSSCSGAACKWMSSSILPEAGSA